MVKRLFYIKNRRREYTKMHVYCKWLYILLTLNKYSGPSQKKKKKERRNLGHSIHNAMEDCDLQE
jgi:hypothetical protein